MRKVFIFCLKILLLKKIYALLILLWSKNPAKKNLSI